MLSLYFLALTIEDIPAIKQISPATSIIKGKNKPELSLKDIATARLIVPKTNSNVPIKTSPGLYCLSIILPHDMF